MGIFDIKNTDISARTMTLQTHGLSITFLMNVQRTKTEKSFDESDENNF